MTMMTKTKIRSGPIQQDGKSLQRAKNSTRTHTQWQKKILCNPSYVCSVCMSVWLLWDVTWTGPWDNFYKADVLFVICHHHHIFRFFHPHHIHTHTHNTREDNNLCVVIMRIVEYVLINNCINTEWGKYNFMYRKKDLAIVFGNVWKSRSLEDSFKRIAYRSLNLPFPDLWVDGKDN